MLLRITALLFIVSACAAQTEPYVVRQWNIEDGLPQSTVRCITQTPDGYLWVGTWQGLARFDGLRMTVFTSANTPALYTSNIMSLYSNRRGQLWIGTDAGGLVRYVDGAFQRFDSTDGISASRILSIAEDGAGRMWFATEIGIFSYAGKKFLHFTEANGLPRTYANQVLPFPDGEMYLGFVGYGARVRPIADSLAVEETFPVGGYTVSIDSAGAIWFGDRKRGFVRRENGREVADRKIPGEVLKETFILRSGEKWVLTPGDIRIISDSIQSMIKEIGGIVFSEITTVFEDREGILWLGKEGGGLIRLKKKMAETLSEGNGFPADNILCVLEDRAGKVWIGTWESGLLCSSSSFRSFSRLPLPNGVSSIYTLCESRNRGIWAGSWGSGLYEIRDGHIHQFLRGIVNVSTSIVSVAEDARGGLWVGTSSDGIEYFNGTEEKVWNSSTGWPFDRVNAILCGRNGDTWITVSAGGVVRISNGVATVFKKGSGLNDNSASPLYEDADGVIWVGTNRGLARWKDGKFNFVSEEQGLFDGIISQIIEDDLGDFWIGAIHGIYRVSKQELNDAADGKIPVVQCFTVSKEDGMLIEETAGGGTPRCWKTSDGRLWFSTSRGVVVIDPRTVASNPYPPSVILEKAWIENRPASLQKSLTLHPGQTKIELQFTGINFAAPQKIRFKYFLEGFEKEWNDAGTTRLARYTNLDPGRYTFHVIAVNSAGVWNEKGASVDIAVLPPFYATWWFRMIVIGIFFITGPMIYIVRIRYLKREREKQVRFSRKLIESQEAERKRIAAELHDGLGQNLLIIKNKLLVALTTAAGEGKELRTENQVEEASEIVSSTIEEVRSISHNLRPHQLDQLGITKTLRAIVRQANESTAIEFFQEIQDIDGMLSPEEEINLFRIVQESFNNIIKHSGASKAMANVRKETDFILATISDNGKGISSSAGFGISGMEERAKMFGWRFDVRSETAGKGTVIELKMPVGLRDHGKWKMENG